MTLQLDINDYIARTKGDAELVLRSHLSSDLDLNSEPNKKLLEAAEYTLLGRAHRWRPILSRALAQNYGNDYPDLLPLSCSIEFYHAASLIFDDLPSMDNAELRRGQKTCHLKYGEKVALLTGLYLIAIGDTILSDYHDLFKRASDMKKGMISAQYGDLAEKPKSIQDILRIKCRSLCFCSTCWS